MKLITTYEGSDDPFEGDRIIWLRSLPIGGRATKATSKLAPAKRSGTGAVLFEETFAIDATTRLNGDLLASDWGISRIPETATTFLEVDFHARRTLASVQGIQGTNIGIVPGADSPGPSLQVDIGGVYISVADDGAFFVPDKKPWVVTFDSATSSTETLPGLTVNKFRLSGVPQDPANSANQTLAVTKVSIRSIPTNITLKLGQTPPFWVRVGELATADASPNFAEVLNAFLLTAPSENGFYQIPFVIHSDTLARLDVELDIDYVIEQAVLPPHLPEVTLPYNFSTLPGVDEKLTTVALPRQAVPVAGKSTAQVRGEFQPTRVRKGDIGEEPKIFPVRVAPDCSLAQAFQSDVEIALTGIDLPLANTQPGLAGMNVAIQADDDGKPSGEVLIRADVRVEKPLPGQTSWGSATLPSPFRILPNVHYWLVLQSQVGEAYWNATAGTSDLPTLQCSRDGGLSWRAATAPNAPTILAALLRLRDKPDRFSIPVQLQIGKGPSAVRRRLDEYAPLGRIEFNFDFAEKLAEHLAKPELAPPCGTSELLINGSFDDPPHDDGTRRLFGFDAAFVEILASVDALIVGETDLSRGVDLSVERFIWLSINNASPRRIDCAGKIPSNTKPNEIVEAINSAMNQSYPVASFDSESQVLSLCSEGSPTNLELHPWHQELVPQGWGHPAGSAGRIERAKLPTALSSDDLEGSRPLRPEWIVATLNASKNGPAVLTQTVPIVEGCTYALSFRFQYRLIQCIELRERPAGIRTNPLVEQTVTFTVFEEDEGPDPPADEIRIEDLNRGIRGLNCNDRTVIDLPHACSIVELTITTGISQPNLVTVQAFDKDGNRVTSESMSPDGETPQTLKLMATNITQVELTTPTRATGQTDTLLHAICFEAASDVLAILGEAQLQAPSWEVHWLGIDGQLVNRQSAEFGARDPFIASGNGLRQVEARLVAPLTAVHADIRFIQPSPGVLFLDDVSFKPVLETVNNGDFQFWETRETVGQDLVPVGWSVRSGWVEPHLPQNTTIPAGALLRGAGPNNETLPNDTVITQQAEVVAGGTYELRVSSRPQPIGDRETKPIQQRARIELHWLSNEKSIDTPIILPLDGRDFSEHAWSGAAPVGATKAEIRLIQPKGQGNLLVQKVSLQRIDLVDVPLIFLAETPGELTLSNLRVTYDLPQPTEIGLAEAPSSGQTLAGTVGTRRAAMLVQPAEAVYAVTAEIAAEPLESPLANIPATMVAGVGKQFSKILAKRKPPITTIADLAALDPEVVIKGIPQERRLELKTAAEMILAIDIDIEPFAALEAEPLEALLTLAPSELANRVGQPVARAEQLQRELRALRLLIKNDDFQNLHLSALIHGQG